MKNFIKKLTAVTMAMALIGAGTAISEIIPDDSAIVHAAENDFDEYQRHDIKKAASKAYFLPYVFGNYYYALNRVDKQLKNGMK